MKNSIHKEAAGRIWTLRLVMTAVICAVLIQLAHNSAAPEYREAASQQGSYTLKLPVSYGTIYDRNLSPLVNRTSKHYAVLSGNAGSAADIFPYVKDKSEFVSGLREGVPFMCELDSSANIPEDIMQFDVPVRYEDTQTAQHIIGYTDENGGVCGLESDFDDILRRDNGRTSVTFSVDGAGSSLSGEKPVVRYAPEPVQGVVTTLDAGIQHICEKAAKNIKKGAVIVADVQNGDILAIVSRPVYSLSDMESALNSPDSPFINRALCAYPVGSIFKLSTASAAIDSGFEDFEYECTGSIEIESQTFYCHNREGHGMLSLDTAMINSCNPYFIALSRNLSPLKLFETAADFGYGEEIYLTDSIWGDSGYLPDVQSLALPAEKGNFSFGQGMLTATPLQVVRMTCAIANGGILPEMRLIIGETEDGSSDITDSIKKGERAISEETAEKLRKMMIGVVYGGVGFKGRPSGISAAAKTSTAQTGRFDEDGNEYCHGWVTGFFPVHEPKYAVTIIAEDAGYGNDTAAPVFKEIAEAMRDYVK